MAASGAMPAERPIQRARGGPVGGNAPQPPSSISNGEIGSGGRSASRIAPTRVSSTRPMNRTVRCIFSGETQRALSFAPSRRWNSRAASAAAERTPSSGSTATKSLIDASLPTSDIGRRRSHIGRRTSANLLRVVRWILFGYAIGSVPFAYLLARRAGIDVRVAGSGNVGAANVLRTTGTPMGVLVMTLDIAKGAAAVFLTYLGAGSVASMAAAGAAAIVGHI